MTTEIETVEVLKAEVAPVVRRATDMTIVTPQDYESAANGLKEIKGALKKVDAFFDQAIESARKTWKANLAQKAVLADPLKRAEVIYKQKQIVWMTAQEEIRRKEQARLQAAADERARREREALLKKAAQLKTPEKVEALREQAAAVVPVAVQVASVAPEVKGQSVRKTWKARIVKPQDALFALIKFPDWQAYVTINQGELDRFAARTKGAVPMPGIEWYEVSTLASASK